MKTFSPTEHGTERPARGEGDERVRRALEDGVYARERARGTDAGWSIADIAHDLGISDTRAALLLKAGSNVHLRAGQIPLLRPRIRAAVLAAIGCAPSPRRPVEGHVRRLTGRVGRLNELLDRALADNCINEAEAAELRAELRGIGADSLAAAEDVGCTR